MSEFRGAWGFQFIFFFLNSLQIVVSFVQCSYMTLELLSNHCVAPIAALSRLWHF